MENPSHRDHHGRNSTDEKKRIHNELERRRRGTIKENFDQLYDVIPHDDSEKVILFIYSAIKSPNSD